MNMEDEERVQHEVFVKTFQKHIAGEIKCNGMKEGINEIKESEFL